MKNQYMISPAKKIDTTYAWIHDSEEKAINAAIELSAEKGCNVRVSKIIGIVDSSPRYVPSNQLDQ